MKMTFWIAFFLCETIFSWRSVISRQSEKTDDAMTGKVLSTLFAPLIFAESREKKKDIVVFIEIFSEQIGDRIKSKGNNVDLRRLSGCDYALWKAVTSSEKKNARVRISIYRPPRIWNLEKLVSMNSRVFSSHNSKYGNDIHNPSGNIFTLHAYDKFFVWEEFLKLHKMSK